MGVLRNRQRIHNFSLVLYCRAALAGLRLGFGLGHATLIKIMMAIKQVGGSVELLVKRTCSLE